MSSISLNPVALDIFKKEIDYPSIVSSLPKSNQRVMADWLILLKNIEKIEKQLWVLEDHSVSFVYPSHGEMNVVFEHKEAEVEIDVHVFSDLNNIEVLDEALVILSRTSMVSINMSYDKNGSCDVCFYRDKSVLCVYRNVILEINTSDGIIDLAFFSKYIFNQMKNSLDGSSQSMNIEYSMPKKIVVNKDFYIDVKYSINGPYQIKVHNTYYDTLVLLNRTKDKFYYIANKSGTYKVNIGVMNANTLMSENISVSINVENE